MLWSKTAKANVPCKRYKFLQKNNKAESGVFMGITYKMAILKYPFPYQHFFVSPASFSPLCDSPKTDGLQREREEMILNKWLLKNVKKYIEDYIKDIEDYIVWHSNSYLKIPSCDKQKFHPNQKVQKFSMLVSF